ncbi:NitT/TauT family transport system permease protein [Cohnella sp. OV330]|uniref:ABC transporter permease n=1 Tax=Cohnella sp. OV330 TaxID=1855288 RepID=UPI0008DFB751|nr:ABC transporter permease [Cohnella sp. OV330]SFB45157.1 NitT/TauT family transport system permease protein [Cohnella sp. OV330]
MTTKFKDMLYPVAFAVGLILIWEAVVRLFDIPLYLLPAPTDIARVIDGELLRNMGVTLYEAVLGFLLANVLGFLTAILFVHSRPAEKGIFPLAIALKTTPVVALAPLLVIWLGTGYWSKVAASMIICFFPILVNSVKGLKAVEHEAWELFSAYKGTKAEIFWKLRLPTSLPYVLSALKISSSLAIVGAIVGEFVGSNKGLGYLVLLSSYHLDTPVMFSAIAAAAVAGLILFGIIASVEKRVIFWQKVDEA